MPRPDPRVRRAFRILLVLLALSLLPFGLYALRVFELCSRFLAALSLFSISGRALPRSIETVFLLSQSILLAACFTPALAFALARKLRWQWPAAFCLLVFGVLQTSQYFAYLNLRAALPQPAPFSNQCPRFSASGLEYVSSRILGIDPGLLIEVNNEQCMMLKLAHDTELGMDTDWEVFRLKAYNPRFIPRHYAQNAIFPLSVAMAKSLRRMDLIEKDRVFALKLVDKASITYDMSEAMAFVLKNQDQEIPKTQASTNPFNAIAAKLAAWEESSILKLTRKGAAPP